MANTTLVSLFSDIASAIRTKAGTSEAIVATNFPSAILSIPTTSGSKLTFNSIYFSLNKTIASYYAAYNTSTNGLYATTIDGYIKNYNDTLVKFSSTTINSSMEGTVIINNLPETVLTVNDDSGEKDLVFILRGDPNYFEPYTMYFSSAYDYTGYIKENTPGTKGNTITLFAGNISLSSTIDIWNPGYQGSGTGYINKFLITNGGN